MNTKNKCINLNSNGLGYTAIANKIGVCESTVRYYLVPERKQKQLSKIAEHRRRIKRKAINYSGGKCLKCGYDRFDGALDFHHINPDEKDITISSGCTRSWELIKKEVDKCIIVCSRCHIEIHGKIMNVTMEDVQTQNTIRANYIDLSLWRYSDRLNVLATPFAI